jgi:hypothetical protein
VNAGVQKTRIKQINALLDAGFRRHDEIVIAATNFNKLIRLVMGATKRFGARFAVAIIAGCGTGE